MDIGVGSFVGIIKGLAGFGLGMVGSPLRITVLEGQDRQKVVTEASIRSGANARVIPRWVPGDSDTPPPTEMFDAENLYLSIEKVAHEQRWLPVDQDRVVLHIYNKSDDAVFFNRVWATAHPVLTAPMRGCVVQLGAGGSLVQTFGLSVALHSDRSCSVSANLDLNEMDLTTRSFQLGPRESLHLLVDAGIGIGETSPVIDWCLWFELDANRGLRSRRQVRVPAARKYQIGPRRTFRIVNGTGMSRFVTQSTDTAASFTWHLEPALPPVLTHTPEDAT